MLAGAVWVYFHLFCEPINRVLKLREFGPHTPAIFYSGDAFEDDRRRALEAGASAYLIKPAEPAELVDAVSRLVGG